MSLLAGLLVVILPHACAGNVLSPSSRAFAVTDFGAVPDGRTLATSGIQAAVAAASRAGGGYVVIPGSDAEQPGEYHGFLSGTISLADNVYLWMEKGSLLLASDALEDYAADYPDAALITMQGVRNTGILGNNGTIDGQAPLLWNMTYDAENDRWYWNHWKTNKDNSPCSGECRPRLLKFRDSSNVTIANVSYGNSADWTSHFVNCSDLLIERVTVFGNKDWPNNDAIDIDNCNGVVVRHSNLSTGDDGVCLKSAVKGSNSNVHVHDLRISSKSSAIKFGSTTVGSMQDMLFENVYIYDSNRGMGLQMRDDGVINNITFRNIEVHRSQFVAESWWGNGEPIWITAAPRCRTCVRPGQVTNVSFENVRALSENGIVVASFAHDTADSISGVRFRNVSVTLAQWTSEDKYFHPYIDFKPSDSPSEVPMDVQGVLVYNAGGVHLEDTSVSFSGPRHAEWDSCFKTINASNVQKSNFHCHNASDADLLV